MVRPWKAKSMLAIVPPHFGQTTVNIDRSSRGFQVELKIAEGWLRYWSDTQERRKSDFRDKEHPSPKHSLHPNMLRGELEK
jgi:hypothetical protein